MFSSVMRGMCLRDSGSARASGSVSASVSASVSEGVWLLGEIWLFELPPAV